MKAYRYSVKLKLGLIVFAVLIAVASLAYTNQLVDRLRDREQFIIQLWASAQEHMASGSRYDNPYLPAFQEIEALLESGTGADGTALSAEQLEEYERALAWARSMPPPGEVTLASEIVLQGQFGIPAIITDSTMTEPIFWHNVDFPESIDSLTLDDQQEVKTRLIEKARSMSASYEPIPVVLGTGPNRLKQYIFYDDSRLVRELRFFPYVQLLFVGLFILVGYLGFSYVRRSEQSSLWVGMAKEAAHQLGTPISSLMGWTELMKSGELTTEQQEDAIEEIENDIQRLSRVASRFSDIGSLPKLDVRPVAPVVEATAEYIRRRMPRQARSVELNVSVPPELRAPLNAELFEWVIENLLKNALDAIESDRGSIDITAQREDGRVLIDAKDSGKGIDRRNWKNVFRPGYSTKKRGWGLGLSLAKRIVEDYHGGSLTLVSSRVGYGTTFRIALPEGRAEGGSVRKGM
ncbi:MAG: HAMP domain-containing sensor histidine kinase [Rhodothermales bacterium]